MIRRTNQGDTRFGSVSPGAASASPAAQPNDRFTREETVDGVVAGCGPVAITSRVHGVSPGDWNVSARIIQIDGRPATAPTYPAAWSWRRWRLTEASRPVRTCLAPLARPPAQLLGSWIGLTPLGVLVALVMQAWLGGAEGLTAGHTLRISLPAILAGLVGAKIWYLVVNRGKGATDVFWLMRLLRGWCVQGFLAGAALAAPPSSSWPACRSEPSST